MQKCSHKIPVTQYCSECERLAKAKGLDPESQQRKFEEEWSREIELRARREARMR